VRRGLSWGPEDGALSYNVYRGLVSEPSAVEYGSCSRSGIEGTEVAIPEDPPSSAVFTYQNSEGVERVDAHPCQ